MPSDQQQPEAAPMPKSTVSKTNPGPSDTAASSNAKTPAKKSTSRAVAKAPPVPALAAVNEDESHMLAISNAINKMSLGYSIVYLVDPDSSRALGLEAPNLVANSWNSREASDEAVDKLWKMTNRGQSLEWHSMDNAVLIGLESRAQLSPTWVSDPGRLVEWAPDAKKTTMININGNHRRALVKNKLIGKKIDPLIQVSPNLSSDRRKALQKEIIASTRWLAHFFDLSVLNSFPADLQEAVKDHLSKNQATHMKPDTFFERLANIAPSFLTISSTDIHGLQERLRPEIIATPESNKAQRGILYDASLVYSLCVLLRFKYFTQPNLFTLDTFNTSRTFSAAVVMPAVAMHAKFYLTLCIPSANPTSSLENLQTYIDQLDPMDSRIIPDLLPPIFFAKLDQIYQRTLFDCFQTFMTSSAQDTYYQSRVPVIESDVESSEAEEGCDSSGTILVPSSSDPGNPVVNISWKDTYRESYMTSVHNYVEAFVILQKKSTDDQTRIQAYDMMVSKIDTFLDLHSNSSPVMSIPAHWVSAATPLPLVTPIFLNSLLASLNTVENAIIAISIFIEPMSMSLVKRTRGTNSSSLVHILTQWTKEVAVDNVMSKQIMQKIIRIFLRFRDKGLAKLNHYLQKNKAPTVTFGDLSLHYIGKDGVKKDYGTTLTGVAQQSFYLNTLFYTLATEKVKGGLSTGWPHLFSKYVRSSPDSAIATTFSKMMATSTFDWGHIRVPEMTQKAPRLSQQVLDTHWLALHVWKAFELDPSIYEVYSYLRRTLAAFKTKRVRLWTEDDSWVYEASETVESTKGNNLSYLAPLQQNAAYDVQQTTQKNIISRLNRIVADAAYISAVGGAMPDDVNHHVKALLMPLEYYGLSQIKRFDSVNDLKAVDMMTQDQIHEVMKGCGLNADLIDKQAISRAAWKKNLKLPSHVELQPAVKKRLRATSTQKSNKKAKKDDKGKGKAKEVEVQLDDNVQAESESDEIEEEN